MANFIVEPPGKKTIVWNVISCIISLNIIGYIIRPLRTMVVLCMLQYVVSCASVSENWTILFLILATEFRNLNCRAISFPNDSLSFSSWTFLARATAVVVVVVAQVRSSILHRVRRHGPAACRSVGTSFAWFLQQFPKCRSIVSILKWDKIFFGFARHSY